MGVTHIYIKGVTERFGFDVSELRNFNYLSKTKQRERLMGCLYTALIGYLPFFGNISSGGVLYIHRRGAFSVARFDR